GPSGSGKSTLLHMMAGIDAPTAGTVSWPGLGPGGPREPGAVGFVFQGPSLLPALNVTENVALPLLLGGHADAPARRSATAILGRLGLDDVALRLPDELSGGQAQRAAVARALVASPRLVLADEPTGQLDHDSARLVVDALTQAAGAGSAIVMATHDPTVAAHFDRRWSMVDGRVLVEVQACSA
ncbi:MAG: ATP-binding cassette protein, partial [Acidimicrobiales bacterium]|nr:ATP-binding cassette protein [Acidimicrobiales bacterium]